MYKNLLLMIGFSIQMSPLSAAIIWDETTDGDLSNNQATPTQVIITKDSALDTVIGKIGGDNPGEFFDVFSFELFYGFCLDSIVLADYEAARGNVDTGFNLHSGPASVGANYLVGNAAGEANIGEDVLGGEGPFPTGVYTLDIRESTRGQKYELNIVLCSEALWNETIDGDFSNDAADPTFLDIPATDNSISGVIGGADTLGIDAFSLTVPAGFQMEVFFRAYETAGANVTTGFNFYHGLNGADGTLIETAIYGKADVGQSMNNKPLAAGDYSVVILERTEGQRYGLDFTLSVAPDGPDDSDIIFANNFE